MHFRNQLIVGHATLLLATLLIGVTSAITFRAATNHLESALGELSNTLLDVERLQFEAEQVVSSSRGFVLTGDEETRQHYEEAVSALEETLRQIKKAHVGRPAELEEVETAARAYVQAAGQAVQRRSAEDDPRAFLPFFERTLTPARRTFDRTLSDFVEDHRTTFRDTTRRAENFAAMSRALIWAATALALTLGICLAVSSIRRLKARYARERQATELATRAVASRDEVFAVVSHDLRGPLQTITIGVGVMEDEVPAHARRHLAAIGNAAERMDYLIAQLLDLAKLDIGAFEVDLAPCSVRGVVESVFSIFEVRAASQHVSLVSRVDLDIGSLVADRDRILQVLSNLVGNALKFTPPEGAISIAVRRDEGEVRFAVSDTGPGIPPGQAARIFERYWQGKAAPRTGGGLGLGLYICKRIIEAHGGRMGVDSSSSGATFWFCLPASQE